MTPQQKLLHVAKNLGISDMKNMQGSTGVLYHNQNWITGPGAALPNYTFFGGALQGASWIYNTNVNTSSKLEVNEALLIEKVAFHQCNVVTTGNTTGIEYAVMSNQRVVFDLYIGNKRVLKQVRTQPGNPFLEGTTMQYWPGNSVYLEGAGIVIPPQVEFYVTATIVNASSGQPITTGSGNISCSLYGTSVLLNLNTSL